MSLHKMFCTSPTCRICLPDEHAKRSRIFLMTYGSNWCLDACNICHGVNIDFQREQRDEIMSITHPVGNASQNLPWAAEAQLVTSEVFGVRSWLVDAYSRLRPVHTNSNEIIWTPGVNNAVCPYDPCSRVTDGCTCGFYAWTDYEAAKREVTNGTTDITNPITGGRRKVTSIAGAISALGEVMISTKGFRASQAKVVALVDPPALVHKYYPDAQVLPSIEALFDEYGVEQRNPKNDPEFWTKP